jgi:hypothetical protein
MKMTSIVTLVSTAFFAISNPILAQAQTDIPEPAVTDQGLDADAMDRLGPLAFFILGAIVSIVGYPVADSLVESATGYTIKEITENGIAVSVDALQGILDSIS